MEEGKRRLTPALREKGMTMQEEQLAEITWLLWVMVFGLYLLVGIALFN